MNQSRGFRKAAELVDDAWRSPNDRWRAYGCNALIRAHRGPSFLDFCAFNQAKAELFAVFSRPDKISTGAYVWGEPTEISTKMHNARVLGLLFLAEMTK